MAAWYPILATLLLAPAQPNPELAPPVRLTANGKPINVEIGHAAPCYADLDGSGKKVLLVGQFAGGKLRIYPNQGTAGEPKFEAFHWFQGTVPAS
jgi:hypothetical protein